MQARGGALAGWARERSREKLRLVVTTTSFFFARHRNGNDGIERDVVAHDQSFMQQVRERIVEKIVALEFEFVQQPFESAGVKSPRVAP